jgi:hypothetical protein
MRLFRAACPDTPKWHSTNDSKDRLFHPWLVPRLKERDFEKSVGRIVAHINNLRSRYGWQAEDLPAATVVSGPGFEGAIKVVSAVNQREMRERLRKVSELAALFGIVLF